MPTPGAAKATSSVTPKWTKTPIAGLYVNSVAISSDGSKVVAGNYSFPYKADDAAASKTFQVSMYAWDDNGNQLWSDPFEVIEGIYWVAISRDGSTAACGGLEASEQGFIYGYDAVKGARTLSYTPGIRTNMVALSDDGTSLVAGADAVYLFTRSGSTWSAPSKVNCPDADDRVIGVGISSDGSWVVAGTYNGYVMLMANTAGKLSSLFTWQLTGGSINLISMGAGGTGFAAAGGDNTVYFFNVADFQNSQQPTWSIALDGCDSCRSVAVCEDASVIAAAGNVGSSSGTVFLFSNEGTSAKQLWSQNIQHNPNLVAVDAAGKYVAAADGHPDGTPGCYYLFDAQNHGNQIWSYGTTNMSWPIQIAAQATGVFAGSDDSSVYYFDTFS
jgi:WD40 repeat protein